MKVALRIAAFVFGALVIAVIVITVIGSRLPQEHVASRSMRFSRPPADIYATVHDFASFPDWRDEVQRVEMLGMVEGRQRFREHSSQGTVTYEVMESVPNEKLVTRIVDRDLGYSGSWTYAIAQTDGGSELTITEKGDVPNVFFRFMSRYVFGHAATIERYLAALDRHMRER